MLVRAGLPSRIAARSAIEQDEPAFTTLSEMTEWLSSDEIAALSESQTWPTPETAAIWSQFRRDFLAAPIQRWNEQQWNFASVLPAWAKASYPARIQIDEETGSVTVTSPDFRQITAIQQGLFEPPPSLMHVDYASDRQSAVIKRMGRGTAGWRRRT
jgi:hypothetical protein